MQRLERSIAKLLTFGDQRLAECNRLIKDAGKLKLDGLKGQKKKDTQREKNEAQRNADAELARAVSSYNTAAKLEAEATKKRRAATELTRWREDWANTEKLEEELRKLREMHH